MWKICRWFLFLLLVRATISRGMKIFSNFRSFVSWRAVLLLMMNEKFVSDLFSIVVVIAMKDMGDFFELYNVVWIVKY